MAQLKRFIFLLLSAIVIVIESAWFIPSIIIGLVYGLFKLIVLFIVYGEEYVMGKDIIENTLDNMLYGFIDWAFYTLEKHLL